MERKMDELGRLVIPMDFRKIFGPDKLVKIVETEEGILLTNPNQKIKKPE